MRCDGGFESVGSEGGGGVGGRSGKEEVQVQDVVSLRAQSAVRRTLCSSNVVTRRSWLEAGWAGLCGSHGLDSGSEVSC